MHVVRILRAQKYAHGMRFSESFCLEAIADYQQFVRFTSLE